VNILFVVGACLSHPNKTFTGELLMLFRSYTKWAKLEPSPKV